MLPRSAHLTGFAAPHHRRALQGLFNFKPSVRPVPLECHIQASASLLPLQSGGAAFRATLAPAAGPHRIPPGAVPALSVAACMRLCRPCNAPSAAHAVQGYPGKFYCPRMATMNKPAYAAIQTHSPIKPVSCLCDGAGEAGRARRERCCVFRSSQAHAVPRCLWRRAPASPPHQ